MGYYLLQKNETFNDTVQIWSQKIQGRQSSPYWFFENISIINTEKVVFYINDNRLSPVASSNIWWTRADGTDCLWSESIPDPCSKITIRIDEDILLQYATQNFNLTVVFTAPGWMPDISLVENQEMFDGFLKDRGLKLKIPLTSSPRVFCDNAGTNWLLLSEDVDLIVSNGLPLNQTDNVNIYTKNKSNYSLFQHPNTVIEEYYYIRLQSINDIEEDILIPMLNNQNEWVIHLYADVFYNMSDIEFVFETPFESDRDIQFFLEKAYNQTKVNNTAKIIGKWFDVESGVENIHYWVASQAQGTALAIEPRIPVDRFEINLMGCSVRIENGDKNRHTYAYKVIDGITTVWEISSENESLYNNIIYIQYGLFGTENLHLWDNQAGRLITQTSSKIRARLVFALDQVECGYCRVDELATMLGFTSVQIQDNENHQYALDKEYYAEIYKTTSGKYTILACDSDINPGNKLLLPQGYHFILYNIDETTINMNDSNLSDLAPSPFKKIYNIETPLRLLFNYYYFETAFYNHKRQLSYDNILIENKEEFFNILKNHGAQIKSEDENGKKWQYDSNNHRWYGSEPLFVEWKDYEALKIKDSTTPDFYSYKNMNNFLMIPYTTSEIINNEIVYYIDPKEIALCRYDIDSYLFNNNSIENQIKRSSFSHLLNSNRIEVGQLSKDPDKQYLALEKDKIYYDSTGKQTVDINSLTECGYSYIKIPRYKITEGSQEKYFKLLSIPANRYSTSNYNNQYFFSLNEEQTDNQDIEQNKTGLDYSEKEKNINAEYWTTFPEIYPEIVFNTTTSLDDDNHTLTISSNKIILDDKIYHIYPTDKVVYYERNSKSVTNIGQLFDTYETAPWKCPGTREATKGALFINGTTNSGKLTVPISMFSIPVKSQSFIFNKKIQNHTWNEISSSLFKKIIAKTQTEIPIENYLSGIKYTEGRFDSSTVVPFVLAFGLYECKISQIPHTIFNPYHVTKVTLVNKAHFTFTLQTDIDYINDKKYTPFIIHQSDLKTTVDGKYNPGSMGDVPNGGWGGEATVEQVLTPSWLGTLSGNFSFFGDSIFEYTYGDNGTVGCDVIHYDEQGENKSFYYYHRLSTPGGNYKYSRLFFKMDYNCPDQTGACAIVIWRNGKLNPQNPEYLNFYLTKKQNENSYGLTKYIGQHSIITVPTQYNNIPITVIEKNSIPDFVKKLTCNHEIQIENDAFLKKSSLETLELYNLPNDGLSRCFYDPNPNIGPDNLRQIIIKQKVTEIPKAYFAGLSSLNTIDLSGSILTKIDDGACIGCTSLKEIRFTPTELLSIGDSAFEDCKWFSIDLSEAKNLKTIAEYAFARCKQLKSLNLSNTQLIELKSYTFLECGIQQIQLPNTLTKICARTFQLCGLTEISIPRSVTEIEYNAFIMCNSLKKIWIPKEVTSIGYQILMSDYYTTIYCEVPEKPEGWSSDWIKGNYEIKWNSSFEDYQSA